MVNNGRGEGVTEGNVSLWVNKSPFVGTADNIADFFTKPLDAKAFFRFRNIIMNVAAP